MSKKPVYEFELVTTSDDATPTALQGSVYWYDSGTEENSEIVYYDASDTYAYWNDGTDWMISIIALVGEPGVNYFGGLVSSITLSGAGTTLFNGLYERQPDGAFEKMEDVWELRYVTDRWSMLYIGGGSPPVQGGYENITTDSITPPVSGWTIAAYVPSGSMAINPVPTGVHGGLDGSLTGHGTYVGILTLSQATIQEAWNRAERAVFDSLMDFVGGTDRVNAFRGRFPTNKDGEIKWRNVWKINSGGAASAFDSERTYGDNGNWCSLMVDAEIEGYFGSRVVAMNFASTVLAWLKHTDNLKTVSGSNVNWCMLTDLPQPPEPVVGVKKVSWSVTIPLQILYLTSGEF